MFLGHDESDAVYKYIRLKRPKLRNMCPKKILFSEESAEYIFFTKGTYFSLLSESTVYSCLVMPSAELKAKFYQLTD